MRIEGKRPSHYINARLSLSSKRASRSQVSRRPLSVKAKFGRNAKINLSA